MGALALLVRTADDVPDFHPVKSEQRVAVQELTVEQRQKRDERWTFCKMVIDMVLATGKSQDECCQIVAVNEAGRFAMLNSSGKHGATQLTYNNCRNWLLKLGKGRNGYNWENRDSLVDSYVSGVKARRGDDLFWQLFLAFYLNQNKLSVEESHRLAAAKARKDNPFAVIPKVHQARYRVAQLDPTAVALARHGEEYVKDHHIGYIKRDWTDVKVNEIWIADHRQFDCAVRVFDDEKQAWVAVRPWLCGFMDAKSWYMVSWQITTDSPNNLTVANGLALGIIEHGRPGYAYTDNGKDFVATGFAQPVKFGDHEHSILNELNIGVITSLPYNGRAKTIERNFKNIATAFDKFFSSYLGNRPGARPDCSAYFWKNAEQLPSLEEFTECFRRWIELLHDEPNNGMILGGMTPREMFATGKKHLTAPMSKNELYAAFLMPLPELRTVHRGPAVKVNNTEYYDACLWPFFDKEVMVKIDRLNPEHVFAFRPDGTPIGECRTRTSIKAHAKTDADRSLISEQMGDQRRDLKRAKTLVASYTNGLNLLTPQELLKIGGDFEIVKVGSMRSVKGASHKFEHYQVKRLETSDGQVVTPGSAVAEELDFKEDRKEAQMAKFEAVIMGKTEDDKTSVSDIKQFHKFVISSVKNEEEDYE